MFPMSCTVSEVYKTIYYDVVLQYVHPMLATIHPEYEIGWIFHNHLVHKREHSFQIFLRIIQLSPKIICIVESQRENDTYFTSKESCFTSTSPFGVTNGTASKRITLSTISNCPLPAQKLLLSNPFNCNA